MAFIKDQLMNHGMNEIYAFNLSAAILAIVLLIACLLIQFIMKKVVLRLLAHYIRTTKHRWDTILLERKVFQRLSYIIPAILIYLAAPLFLGFQAILQKLVLTYILILVVFVLDAVLDSIDDIYRFFPISKIRPIKGMLQVVKIVIYIILGIVIIANLLGESPIVLLSGIGALTAVFSLVFKDSILGFVAGIQLTSNDMLRIGDWIEMEKYGADGDVVEITLNTVKIQNFDKTIVTVPAYAFVSDSFKNWRGMLESGGRRIKRSVYIDTTSICFCTEEMIEKFRKIHYLKDYIEKKEAEIKQFNEENELEDDLNINKRLLTNIGTFRIYIKNYLKNHPNIRKDMPQTVRHLPVGEYGLPLEIYGFSAFTDWMGYEEVQADIFDHILAVASEFELRVFQNPTGMDLRNLGK